MPWDDDATPQQRLVGVLLRALLSDRCSLDATLARRPCAPPWTTHVCSGSALAREPYQARHDLQIVTPEDIPTYVPIIDLLGVFAAAADALAFPSREIPRDSGDFKTVSPEMASRLPSQTQPVRMKLRGAA